MKKLKKLIFFGNERLATGVSTLAPTLRALVSAGYEIEAVITSHSDSVSRQERALEIAPVAQSFNIPVMLPKNKTDLAAKLQKHRTEAAVLVAFGQIIPQEVIDMFPKGIINIHPSLLPKFRGPTPIESAILSGADETGVSLMKLTAEMDAGPVYAQEKIKLQGDETKQQLADTLLEMGGQLLIKNLPAILDGSLAPKPQDDSMATYTVKIDKLLGNMDFSLPAEVLERQVRAYAGWPKSRTKMFGHEIVVTRTGVAKSQNGGQIVVECHPGYLEIQELIAPSGRTMSGADFIRGYSKPN